MAQFQFKPDQPLLTDLLKEIQNGHLQLPEFQRSWVWDDERIRGLIASVSQGWPVGAILLLECGGELRFKARSVEGAPANLGSERRLILDGQQRLTSLYLALKSGLPVKTRSTKQEPIERLYYFDIRKCIDSESDGEDGILSVPASKQLRTDFDRKVVLDLSTEAAEHSNYCIPVATAFDSERCRSWRRAFNEHHQHDRAVSQCWDRFEGEVVVALQGYRMPAIELSKDTSREAVCMVFEKVNTGGKPLDVFELVTASFAASEMDLRADWEKREKRLTKYKVLEKVAARDFLQALTLVCTWKREALKDGRRLVGCRKTEVLHLAPEEYVANADAVERGFVQSAQLMDRECIYDAKHLPYESQLIPLSAIAAVLGPKFLQEPVRNKILQWYWCGVFGELYGGATETRAARDFVDVLEWIASDKEPKTIGECNFAPSRLLTLRTRGAAAYKGFMALLLQTGARDFFQGDEIERSRYFDEKVDIHHVFPVDWCEKNQVPRDRYDSILNKTPLTAFANKKVGGVAPSMYLERITRAGISDIDTILKSHLADPETLRTDDFPKFLRERARLFLDRVEVATGKPVQGRNSDEVAKEFGGDLLPKRGSQTSAHTLEHLFQRFRVLEKIPSGGMSEGFKVESLEDGAVLFLKKVPVSGIPGEALRRELDIYAKLQRSSATNVLQIHAFERDDDCLALVTEYADGGSLASAIRSSGPLPPDQAKKVSLEILSGLRELHSLDVVHRDLKPENILKVGTQWKLADFGISKNLTHLVTQGKTFQGHGTPGFAAPEQVQGAEAHPSADIYSFGKVFAYLLTGQTDVDQIVFPGWARLARICTERDPVARPTLDTVETELAAIPT